MTGNHPESNIHVLITGGGGMIGKHLTSLLLQEGYMVSHLSRKKNESGDVMVLKWDPVKGFLYPATLDGIDIIIHLAGANLGGGRWTRKRKEAILKSRIDSALLICKVISENKIPLKAFISASGINYYGTVTSDKIFEEEDGSGVDFPAMVCGQWEEAADNFNDMGIRTVKIRTAVVLEKNRGALLRLIFSSKSGVFAVPGSGHQFMPWIHIKDLCGIYLKAIQDKDMNGAYNAVAPEHVTGKIFMKTVAEAMNRRFLHIRVPGFILKILFGKMSSLILEGSRISSLKIKNAGYRFEFDNLHDALNDLISPRSASRQP